MDEVICVCVVGNLVMGEECSGIIMNVRKWPGRDTKGSFGSVQVERYGMKGRERRG